MLTRHCGLKTEAQRFSISVEVNSTGYQAAETEDRGQNDITRGVSSVLALCWPAVVNVGPLSNQRVLFECRPGQ